jgi:hypothetical protein
VAQPETGAPCPQARRKEHWWFGWNGERLSNAIDTKKLAEHHPDVLQWVIDSLKGAEQ